MARDRLTKSLAAVAILGHLTILSAQTQQPNLGYDDTPVQPDGKWRIHDVRRPVPPVVVPGPFVSMTPPKDAVILLGDAADLSAWQTDSGAAAPWQMATGVLQTGKGIIRTKAEFTDIQLHVEFATPSTVIGSIVSRTRPTPTVKRPRCTASIRLSSTPPAARGSGNPMTSRLPLPDSAPPANCRRRPS